MKIYQSFVSSVCKKLGHNILNCRELERIRDKDSKDAGKIN